MFERVRNKIQNRVMKMVAEVRVSLSLSTLNAEMSSRAMTRGLRIFMKPMRRMRTVTGRRVERVKMLSQGLVVFSLFLCRKRVKPDQRKMAMTVAVRERVDSMSHEGRPRLAGRAFIFVVTVAVRERVDSMIHQGRPRLAGRSFIFVGFLRRWRGGGG